MKIKLIYLLPLLAVFLITACAKTSNNSTTVVLPTGNFTGQFLRVHYSKTSLKYDTLKANLNLAMAQSTGFAITGDTTTLHAGSYGSYAANAYYIQFVDQTYSATAPFTKYHLSGVYNYTYDGSTLGIYIIYGDTLKLQYNFKKATN